MTVDIDWPSGVITIPQNQLTLISGANYSLDADAFRLALKDLEDSEEGAVWPDTHRHATASTLSGVVYARQIEILPPYTITFQDVGTPYTVAISGANHNIADVKNVNQVSLIVGNSAGLISVTSGSGVTAQDKIDIVNMVWNELIANHDIIGSTAKALSTASSGGVDIQALVDGVWNEPLTGATHNIPTSAGRRLRQMTAPIILEGFVISSTINSVTFDGEASTVNGSYDPSIISIVSGVGSGQCRLILEYNGTTKTAVVDRNWRVQPNATSEYIIVSSEGREHVNEGRVQTGTINTVTLNANASGYDDTYLGQVIFIRSGYAEDQAKRIIAYNGTTKVATVESNWSEIPDNTSGYVILPTAVITPNCLRNAVWDAPSIEHQIAGTTGKALSTASSGGVDIQALVDGVWNEPKINHTTDGTIGKTINDLESGINILTDIQAGNWKIQGTIMIFYKQTGEELFRYSLLDNNGAPSNQNVFQRVKI